MTPNRRKWTIALAIIGAVGMSYAALLKATALSYSASPFQATVVDEETGKPIEGVIVAAVWHLETRGGRGAGFLNVTEAVTDAEGLFHMPGWGPLEVRRDLSSGVPPPRLSPEQPWLILFKSGYRVSFTHGLGTSTRYLNDPNWTGDPIRVSYWNGRSLKLEQFVGDDLAYLNDLRSSMRAPIAGCWWATNPRMTAAMIREGERLKDARRNGRPSNELVRLKDIQERSNGQYCGSVHDILEPLLK